MQINKTYGGVYLIRDGDTPRSIALTVYGDEQKQGLLMEHNLDCDWSPGTIIAVPMKWGRSGTFEADDSVLTVVGRLFPESSVIGPLIETFIKWNGPAPEEGAPVFIPETQKTTY